jgi:hypothetical protein
LQRALIFNESVKEYHSRYALEFYS